MWLGAPATSLAVRGPEPAGGPRHVLRQPHQTSGAGELQRSGLRADLDHRGVDRGEKLLLFKRVFEEPEHFRMSEFVQCSLFNCCAVTLTDNVFSPFPSSGRSNKS